MPPNFLTDMAATDNVASTAPTDSGFFSNLLEGALDLFGQKQRTDAAIKLAEIRAGGQIAANTALASQGGPQPASVSVTATAPTVTPSFLDNLPDMFIPIVLAIGGFLLFRAGVFK